MILASHFRQRQTENMFSYFRHREHNNYSPTTLDIDNQRTRLTALDIETWFWLATLDIDKLRTRLAILDIENMILAGHIRHKQTWY